MNTPIAKKTKGEIIEEYNKLLDSLEEAKLLSKTAHSQPNMQFIAKAKELSPEDLDKAGLEFIKKFEDDNRSYLSRVSDFRQGLMTQIDLELKKFNELQAAVESAKLLLKDFYNIEVSAETLNIVMDNHRQEVKAATEELNKLRADFQAEQQATKAGWARDKEEYDYQLTQRKLRDEETAKQEQSAREKVWFEREAKLKAEETELRRLQGIAEKMPETLAAELAKKDKEITDKLNTEHATILNFKEQDWKAKEDIYKLRLENMEAQIKKSDNEILTLKKEQEQANRKAQDMAIKVIESGANKARPTEDSDNK